MGATDSGTAALPRTVKFDYEKAAQFRTVHADGAIGGITPRGYIQVAFYVERAPIPQVVVHEIREDGTLAGEILSERVVRKDVFRQLEVDVIMDQQAAEALLEWLTKKVDDLKRIKLGKIDNE